MTPTQQERTANTEQAKTLAFKASQHTDDAYHKLSQDEPRIAQAYLIAARDRINEALEYLKD